MQAIAYAPTSGSGSRHRNRSVRWMVCQEPIRGVDLSPIGVAKVMAKAFGHQTRISRP